MPRVERDCPSPNGTQQRHRRSVRRSGGGYRFRHAGFVTTTWGADDITGEASQLGKRTAGPIESGRRPRQAATARAARRTAEPMSSARTSAGPGACLFGGKRREPQLVELPADRLLGAAELGGQLGRFTAGAEPVGEHLYVVATRSAVRAAVRDVLGDVRRHDPDRLLPA
jgi:hypothetical protein